MNRIAKSSLFRHHSGSPSAQRALRFRRAFSILEVLITVIIIGILAVIMVPTLSKRVEESRIRAAQRDLYELREAETRAAIDTGYYYPQHVLDDVVTEGTNWQFNDFPITDTILFEYQNPMVADNKWKSIFIDPQTGDFVQDDTVAGAIYDKMINFGTQDHMAAIEAVKRFGFNGPYISWNHDTNGDDMQEDPWGNPYLMFTRVGMVWEWNSPDRPGVPLGQYFIQHQMAKEYWDYSTFTPTGPYEAATNVFDRPTLLSMGPNGIPGGNLGTATYLQFGAGDDIKVSFD